MESSVVFVQYQPFSSTVCSEAMSKILQQDSGEERVRSKSRPMMSLLQGCSRTYHPRRQKARGREKLWKSKSLECELRERGSNGATRCGRDPKTASDYYHEQSIESSFLARYSKWDDNQALVFSRVEN